MALSAEHKSNLQPFIGNGDISVWVHKSRVERKNNQPNEQTNIYLFDFFLLMLPVFWYDWLEIQQKPNFIWFYLSRLMLSCFLIKSYQRATSKYIFVVKVRVYKTSIFLNLPPNTKA